MSFESVLEGMPACGTIKVVSYARDVGVSLIRPISEVLRDSVATPRFPSDVATPLRGQLAFGSLCCAMSEAHQPWKSGHCAKSAACPAKGWPLCNPEGKWSSIAARRAPALRVAGRAKDVRYAHARPAPLVDAGFVVRSVDLAARPSPTRRAAGRPAQRARRPACRAPGLVAGCLVAAAGWQKRPVLATAPQRRRERRPPPRRKLSPQKRRLIGAPADSCPPPTIQSCSQTIPVKVSK